MFMFIIIRLLKDNWYLKSEITNSGQRFKYYTAKLAVSLSVLFGISVNHAPFYSLMPGYKGVHVKTRTK